MPANAKRYGDPFMSTIYAAATEAKACLCHVRGIYSSVAEKSSSGRSANSMALRGGVDNPFATTALRSAGRGRETLQCNQRGMYSRPMSASQQRVQRFELSSGKNPPAQWQAIRRYRPRLRAETPEYSAKSKVCCAAPQRCQRNATAVTYAREGQ